MSKRIEETLCEARPALAARAYKGNSPMAAVRLFCLACMGGSASEVAKCTDKVCSLWRFRYGKRPTPRKVVPKVKPEGEP
jgi:hypothetical protein